MQRYGKHARGEVAGDCVPPDTAGGTETAGPITSAGMEAGSSAPDSDGSVDAGDSNTGPRCGDGSVDSGEECDDGNTTPADGCNPDCVASGSLRWSLIYDGEAAGDDRLDDVVPIEGGFMVAGWSDTPDGNQDILVQRYDDAGRRLWSVTDDSGAGMNGAATGIALDELGRPWVVGWENQPDGLNINTHAWVALFSLEGDVVERVIGPLGVLETITPIDGGMVMAGSVEINGMQMWVGASGLDGQLLWEVLGEGTLEERARGVAVNEGGDVFVTGGRGVDFDNEVDLFLDRIDPPVAMNLLTLESPHGLAEGQSIATLGSDVFVAGYQLVGDVELGDRQTWCARFTEIGEMVWQDTFDGPVAVQTDEIEAIVVDGNGDLIVGGFIGSGDADFDFWVRRYGPDGSIRWTVTHDEDHGRDSVRGLAIAPDGDILAVGGVHEETDAIRDAWVARLAP
jgi:cysteine-rich repeat protein